MQVPYAQHGRTRQKARTRQAMVSAARALLTEGVSPTVEQAAERAEVSRTTAYRYFANQRELLLAVYPELELGSLLGADAPDGPIARVELVVERVLAQCVEHEPELRAMLRLSLDTGPADADRLPLRQGRVVTWIEDALGDSLAPPERRRLAVAIRAAAGIEPLVWLTDVAGLDRSEATALMQSTARTLLDAAFPP